MDQVDPETRVEMEIIKALHDGLKPDRQ